MAADKRELILDLLANDKTGPATNSASRHVKEVGDSAEKAGKQTDKFSRSNETASDKANDLGDEAKGAASDLAKLDREIKQASGELLILARAFAQADNAADRMDLSKSVRKAENDIRRLSKNKGIIKALMPDPEPAVKSFISKLGAGLASSGGSLATAAGGSVGPVVGGAIGAAAAPVLVSALGSALSAGAGAGLIGGGVALLVKNDAGIQHAGNLAGEKFMTALGERAKVLRAPVLSALGTLQDASIRIVDKIGDAWDKLGPSVVPITRDIVQAAESVIGAITDIAGESGPALEGLGDSVRLLGDGMATALRLISDGGPDAADNLRLIAGVTADLIMQTAAFLKILNELASNEWLTGSLLPLLKKHYRDVANESDKLADSTAAVATVMTDAQKAAMGQRAALDELSKALRAQADPVFALLEAQQTLAEKQKDVAKATKEHGRRSKETKDALRDLAVAALDLEGKAGALGETFNGQVTPELRATWRAAGLTEGQIKDLEKQFQSAKRSGERFAKNYKASVSMNTGNFDRGYTNTIKKIRTLDGRTIRIRTIMNSTGEYIPGQGTQTRAGGGPITKNKPYWVGEQGPELVFPENSGHVLSAEKSRQVMRARAGGGQGGYSAAPRTQTLRLELVGQREIVTMFRYLVRTADLLES